MELIVDYIYLKRDANLKILQQINNLKLYKYVDSNNFIRCVTTKYYHVFKIREELLLYFMNQRFSCISGHVCFSERAYHNFHDTYKFVTILRDPVQRWISHYFYNAYKTHSNLGKIESDDIATFLESDRARSWGHHYVQMLGGLADEAF